MQAVILAGGKGSRLGGDVPKPFVVINGKLLIRHVMDSLPDVIDEIIVVFPRWDSWTWVNYIKVDRWVTQPEPLGTGDALRWAYPYIRGDFLLLAADMIFQTEDIERVCNGGDICLAATSYAGPAQSVIYNDPPQIIEKRPISYPPGMVQSVMLYKFTPDIFAFLPELQLSSRGEYEVQDAINMLSRDYGPGKVTVIEVGEYHHITTGADVDRINRILSRTE